MPTANPDPATETVSRSAWGLLVFLTLLNVLNFVDRTLITALAPLLIADLGLDKTQIGFLAGFGFITFYSIVGLFLGLAADRYKRIPLIAAGLALWSGMTAISGLARNFLHLALPRIFVGVGEATLTPSALSMLGDAFPRRRLAMATGVYYAGIPLGAAAGLIASGIIAPKLGWRACFYILGGIGIAAAAVLLLFREPARRGAATMAEARRQTLGQVVRDLAAAMRRRPSLVFTLLGGALLCYGAGAALHAVTWLVEDRGYGFRDAALRAGAIAIFAGFFGNLAGGAFGDWCARRRANGHLWSLIPMTAFFTPIGLLFYNLAPGTPLFYVCWFITAAGTSAWFGPLFASIQEQAPVNTRATSVAFALLVLNLLGVGPGPLITGRIGDQANLSLGLLSSLCVVALAIPVFWLAYRKANEDGAERA